MTILYNHHNNNHLMIGPNGGGGDGDPTGLARIVSAGWKPSWHSLGS